ncbi:competence type IV pilus assembly protein ComGB [Streptococcus iniae]|uniref:competence type IV pilus assembly protein ComGB n=1 Tax=Streptococcus iniae TaxID=1346 RepID=UPI002B2E9C2F|nr:competence type IV pilus assembly protein ComGB [Streptococcus iniae]WNZ93872.1 competence type IV pilus assembly protein ComGB [Streptococcus iniae]
MDISLSKKSKQRKLSAKKQYQLMQLFHNLFASGFSLSEIVAFLEKSHLLEAKYLDRIKENLISGRSLAEMTRSLGYPDSIVTQISFADIHGNTKESLFKIMHYLDKVAQVRKKTLEVLTYPLILLSFLIAIMFGLRHYLLPQIEESNGLTQFLTYFPLVFLIFLILGLLLTFYLSIRWRKHSQLKQVKQFSRIPFLKDYISLYITAYFAREWGSLMGQGLELSSILTVMAKEQSPLVKEIGQDMQAYFLEGGALHDKVLQYPFFQKELSLMIEYGDIKAKLGQELEIYAQLTWERFFSRLFQATQWIQPIIFLFVALIIVCIYAPMLLPMYHSIGGSI